MPNIAALLKSEITRLSKRTVRAELRPLQASSTGQRHQIASLKRKVAGLEKELSVLRRGVAQRTPVPAEPAADSKVRFVAKGLRAQRQKLGLSIEQCGLLVGVSGGTIYNWKHERAKPMPRQMPAIVALRGMGKRAAQARLQELLSAKPRPRKA